MMEWKTPGKKASMKAVSMRKVVRGEIVVDWCGGMKIGVEVGLRVD